MARLTFAEIEETLEKHDIDGDPLPPEMAPDIPHWLDARSVMGYAVTTLPDGRAAYAAIVMAITPQMKRLAERDGWLLLSP